MKSNNSSIKAVNPSATESNFQNLTENDPQRILIVDDDSDFADSLEELLRLNKYDTALASDYQQAIEIAGSYQPHVALLDIRLGLINGVDLIEDLNKATPHTQCIMLTGYASLDSAISALRLGAYDYLTKPPHPEELLLTIERCCHQIEMQKQHAQTTQALELSELRNRSILDFASDCIIVTDEDGCIETFNNSAETVFEYTEQEASGTSIYSLIKQHSVVNSAPSGIAEIGAIPMLETIAYRKSGSSFPVQLTISKTRFGGRYIYTYIIRDISERIKSENEIRQLNQELEQRVAGRTAELEATNRELEAFCYSVSHDLRAPLRAINGYSVALLEDYSKSLDEAGRNYLQRICGATHRMSQLIDDLLALSKVTRREICNEAVDLGDICREICKKYLESANTRTVEFVINDTAPVQADPNLIYILLDNLLNNAWKYTSKRDMARIEFGYSKENGKEAYFVRDNGVGFDMRYAGKLFGAFQRLHVHQDFEGTGVGLATVQRIINRHGGEIWAQSEEGNGAPFYFTLSR